MTHLRIELSSNNEIVTSSLITKLYEIAHAGLDASSNLKGYITAPHAKRTLVEYLLNLYPELTINVTGEYYVEFADPNTEKLLMSTYNISGEGICPGDITQNNIHNMDSFNGHPSITSFNELPLFTSITKIAAQGLLGQSQLTSINLQNITGIDAYSFLGCTNLASLGDTSNITYIRNSAFEDCSSLTSFNFSNVTEIGNTAFKNTKITSVTLDNDVTLGNDAFAGCNSLLSVAMPEQTAIGAGAFGSDTNLNTVSMPSVQTIHGWAFYNCTNLETVTMPSSITLTAGEINHFNNCQKLLFPTPLTINYLDTNTRPIYSFASCKKLKKVILGQNVLHIGKCMFYECEDLEEILNTDKIVYVGDHCFYKTKLTGTLNLPNCIGFSVGYYVGESNNGVGPFHTCGLSKIILGDFDLTQTAWHTIDVGRSLFYNMPNLETVDFKSITHMPNFNNNSSFENTALFSYCPSMKHFILRSTTVPPMSNSNTTLDIRHFGGSNVTIYVPDAAVNDYKAASGWSDIASYIHGIKEFPGEWEFVDKTFSASEFLGASFTSVIIKGNTNLIPENCFKDCTNLTSVVIPSTVGILYNNAFLNTAITEVTVDDLDLYITKRCKSGGAPSGTSSRQIDLYVGTPTNRTKVTDVVFPTQLLANANNGADTFKFEGYSIESIEFPWITGATDIPVPICVSCKSLKRIYVDEGYTLVGYHAFEEAGPIEEIWLPSTFVGFGQDAFKRCTYNNNKVICLSTTAPTNVNTNPSGMYYCPDSAISSYGAVSWIGSSNVRGLSLLANLSDNYKNMLVTRGCTATGSTGNWVIKAPGEI